MAWAMYGMTLEELEALGVSMRPTYQSGHVTSRPHKRYCAHCACAQQAVAGDPCWNCGLETQFSMPAFWPYAGAHEDVIKGKSFSAWELDVSEEVVALILEGFSTGGMGDDAVLPQSILAGASE